MIYHQLRDSFIDIVMANGGPADRRPANVARYWAERHYGYRSIPWDTLGPEVQAEWVRITTLMLNGS